jgi:hypothetical protein
VHLLCDFGKMISFANHSPVPKAPIDRREYGKLSDAWSGFQPVAEIQTDPLHVSRYMFVVGVFPTA